MADVNYFEDTAPIQTQGDLRGSQIDTLQLYRDQRQPPPVLSISESSARSSERLPGENRGFPDIDIDGITDNNPNNPNSGRFSDGGTFVKDQQGRITKTASADGCKVREFGYENPNNPDEITRIQIDGNRLYIKGEGDAWNYYENGQYRGQWHGTVQLDQKTGLYSYNQSDEGTPHYFGSARDEADPSTVRIDDVDDNNPQPDRPEDRKPDDNKPKDKLKEEYKTGEAEQALRDAIAAGVPVVVHVGASWCGPCQHMERSVWPGIQHDLKGKAVFLHIDADQAKAGAGGAVAQALADGVGAYPTILVVKPSIGADGKITFQRQQSHTGAMSIDEVRRFIGL